MADLSLYDYKLPDELVAVTPSESREESRLLCLDRKSGRMIHRESFVCIKECLEPGDLLIINDARVFPARMEAHRQSGGRVEILLVRPCQSPEPEVSGAETRWVALMQSGGTLKPGEPLKAAAHNAAILIEEDLGRGYMQIRFDVDGKTMRGIIESAYMPLPPYIRKARRRRGEPEDIPQLDRLRYQTVYARAVGAVAAPTAGLHFSEKLLDELRRKGVDIRPLTLFVGPGTFMPVRTDNIEDHHIDPEFYHLPGTTALAVQNAMSQGRRIVATGTTSVRVLEHVARTGNWCDHSGWTGLYIRPPFEFRVTGALITNFHLPRSTLLMLVSAFAGREKVLSAYREAIRRRYRFYSYGDATFIF